MFRKNKPQNLKSENKSIVKHAANWLMNLPKSIFETKLSHNSGTKFLSLALAVLFWFFVMDQVDPEITRVFENIPVQLTNTQELDQNNLKIMNQTDFFVNVEVTGRRNNVLGLNSKNIYLWADMRSVRSGINNVFINSTINSESVGIKAVLPTEIVLTVDRVVSLPKPVKIVLSDDFQESLFQESLEVNPIEIKVTGPESLVNSVSYLGGTISVNTITANHEREVSLVPYSFDGEVVNGVSLERSYAKLNLSVGKTKLVPIIADVDGEALAGFKIVSVKTIPEIISLSGEIGVIDKLENIYTDLIQLNGDESSSFIVEKELVLPQGVKMVGQDGPIQIEFVIEQIQTKEFQFDIGEIPKVNLDEKFTIDLSANPPIISVKVMDIESIIADLTKNDILLDVNFSNVIAAGIYRLQINVAEDGKFEQIEINPLYIDVNVIEGTTEVPNP
jgi:hypothetical protein